MAGKHVDNSSNGLNDDGEEGYEAADFGENNLLNYNFNNNEAQEVANLTGQFQTDLTRPQNSKGTSRFVKTGGGPG